jgi:hypothetical protein
MRVNKERAKFTLQSPLYTKSEGKSKTGTTTTERIVSPCRHAALQVNAHSTKKGGKTALFMDQAIFYFEGGRHPQQHPAGKKRRVEVKSNASSQLSTELCVGTTSQTYPVVLRVAANKVPPPSLVNLLLSVVTAGDEGSLLPSIPLST